MGSLLRSFHYDVHVIHNKKMIFPVNKCHFLTILRQTCQYTFYASLGECLQVIFTLRNLRVTTQDRQNSLIDLLFASQRFLIYISWRFVCQSKKKLIRFHLRLVLRDLELNLLKYLYCVVCVHAVKTLLFCFFAENVATAAIWGNIFQQTERVECHIL